MSSNFRRQLEGYLANIDVKADAVLDIGGLQLPIKNRVKSWDVKEYKILDVIPDMDGNKADYVADISRSLDFHKEINELEASFDLIFCLEVMEYVFDPVTAIKNIYAFLKPGGVAFISFPFLYPIHPPLDTDFMRYTEQGALRLLNEAGFKDPEVYVRRAGPGRATLAHFYDEEGMRYRRDDLSYLDHIGYIIKAERQ